MKKNVLGLAGRAVMFAVAGSMMTGIAAPWRKAEPPHESAPAKTKAPASAGHDADEPPKPAMTANAGKGAPPPPGPSSKGKGGRADDKRDDKKEDKKDEKKSSAGEREDDAAGVKGSASSGGKLAEPSAQPTGDEAMKLLQEGNERWAKSSPEDPHNEASRRKILADEGQRPFAAVLTCADSRIPVERVFDRGVGDVFVMRVAGNVAGPHEAGSIEYAAEHLHVPLLVVMGHTKCGAVGAAASRAKPEGNVSSLMMAIEPAVERAKKLNPAADDKQIAVLAVSENVWQTIFDLLKTSGPVREMVSKGELKVVGAMYDIADGKVLWLGEHPWQAELVVAFTKNGREPMKSQAQVKESKDEHK